mgnify:CR=1 FL=1
MFITITRTGLCRIGVGLSVFAVLTAVFILVTKHKALALNVGLLTSSNLTAGL